MRVSKEKAAENRAALLSAASRLFREKGIDGVGVAEVAKEAGLTHGALYAHFESKDALAAEAFSQGFSGNMAAMKAWAEERQPSFDDYLEALFSARMRDMQGDGCPMVASASEAGRQGVGVSRSFALAFVEESSIIEATVAETIPPVRRRRLAIAALAAQIGALAVSRAVGKADPTLADEVLECTLAAIRTTYASESQDKA